MRKEAGRTVGTGREARAGRLGRPVLAMLLAGVVLIVILYLIVYLGFF